jgi:catechol 2,3-dioxygenase-like lactoylglutathione lyase family enzyme
MIDHLSLGATDLSRSISFYQRTFAPLGFSLQHETDSEAAFGPGTDRSFWLYPADCIQPSKGMHIAFSAPTIEALDEAYNAACIAGGQSVREPAARPDISADYYGAVVLDPDGNRIELLHLTM